MTTAYQSDEFSLLARLTLLFGISTLTMLAAFLGNTILTYWFDWPGAMHLWTGVEAKGASVFQVALYLLALLIGVAASIWQAGHGLRGQAQRISAANAYLVRGGFWSVLLIGIADAGVSFLRVEDFLDVFVGEPLAAELGRSAFRGPWLHFPLIFLGFVIAAVTRTLGFIWLALLVVLAELLIVFSRFVFSYEQPLMADLVRFWYAALFLFASAYTLVEDAHVRVDLLYVNFSPRGQGRVNAIGAILFGMLFCWTIIVIGMGNASSTINGPILIYEIDQAGFGMFAKYLMAGFLGVFAVTMLIQFVAMFFEAVADILGLPGHRLPSPGLI